jgi:murein DD-endopeptidase MepM/ murein hydrolase activator NlpD
VLSGIQIAKGDNVYKKAFGMAGHNGLDFVAPMDTPVYAVHDGFVFFTTETVGYGKNARQSWAEDGYNWDAIYGHLHTFVGVDRHVKAGELIAYSDNSGFSSGAHLHFGLRPNFGNNVVNYNNGYMGYVDPLPFMKGTFMVVPKRVVKQDGVTHGVLLDTPNGAQIIYATDELQWRSWSKPDSYQLPTVDSNGSTNWATDFVLPF